MCVASIKATYLQSHTTKRINLGVSHHQIHHGILNAKIHIDWDYYNDWSYGYQQEDNWFEGRTTQLQSGTDQPWIQNTSATPVPSTVNDLISALSSGSTSACAIDARMSTGWTAQTQKLNIMLSAHSTLASMGSPHYMMFDTGAAVHVCPPWVCNDYPVYKPYYDISLKGAY